MRKKKILEIKINKEPIPLENGEHLLPEQIPVQYINVNGRKEHEAIIKDADKCKELGLDQTYETIVYLNRWGKWLKNE